MMRRIVILFAMLLWSAVFYAQQDSIVNTFPKELTTDSVASDSTSYQNTIYIVQTGHHHSAWKRSHSHPTLQEKAAKRRHKAKAKEARERRHERMAKSHNRAKTRTSSTHHHSSHSSHSKHSSHSRHRR